MTARQTDEGAPQNRWRPPLRLQLTLGLNAAMVLVLAAFLYWDYASQWHAYLSQRQVALHGEAQAILHAARYLRDRPIGERQRFIDELCGGMAESVSPGHHIVLITEGEALQATAHGRQSEDLLAAMMAAAADSGTAEGPSGEIVVGVAAAPGTTVAVAEQVTDIAALIRRQVLRRTLSILALGVALAVIVNIALTRYVTGPVGRIVEAVRRLKGGESGVQATVPRGRELAFLASEFNAMSSTLAQADERRRAQLDKARRMQQNLLPSTLPAPGLAIATMHEPAEEVAGDFFQACRKPAGEVVLCLADAVGHGVPAAMMASMISVLLEDACAQETEPAAMMKLLSGRLASATLPEDFATVVLVVFDPERGRFSYASAGHEPCYLLRSDGGCSVLDPTGPPVGVVADAEWDEETVDWGAGRRLVLVTDGVAETASPGGVRFGRDRLRGILESSGELEGEALLGALHVALGDFSGDEEQADDLTLIVVDATD